MCMLSISNVIYQKFSHGAAFYTLNGKNVNVMLEYFIAAGVVLYVSRTKPPRTSSIVQIVFYFSPLRSEDIF